MGLDMNIYKKKLVSDNWKVAREKGEKVKRIFEETDMLYLRKANQIHNYIVENFADGVDECQDIDLEIKDIKKLCEICEKILKRSRLETGFLKGGWGCKGWPGGEVLQIVRKVKELETGKCFFEPVEKKPARELKAGELVLCSAGKSADEITKIKEAEGDYVSVDFTECIIGKEIANPELAQELLPTQQGFFFGSTDYDEWYLADLREYVKQAKEIIKDYEREKASGTDDYDLAYYYRASW